MFRQMEKLIELLNEYDNREKYGIKRKIGTDPIGIYGYLDGYGLGFTSKARIISKQYGFIKWLVENEKIDNKKIADETYVKVNGEWYELILGCHYDLYQQVLMLLSIQDEPIEFLVSILK